MGFTKTDVMKWLERDKKAIESLYQQKYLNSKDSTSDTNESYYDVIAEQLIKQLDQNNIFGNIKERTRKQYDMEHKPVSEKWFAKSLLNIKIDDIGNIIDYETPIKNTRYDRGVGEIDLLAYNDKNNLFSLIELKLQQNDDSMLHTILQINTYFHQINRKKLAEDFRHPDADFQKAVIIFRDSRQYKEFKKSNHISKLAEKLEVKVYVLDCLKVSPHDF
jgi:Holliday junction resolvase-like predicted endonuclease